MFQKKRTRASHPKVRTGCHTCKARRVKCDEQRPACLKCVTTGRKCEGYQDRRDWVIIVAPPRPVTDGFEDDRSRRHFDYFRTQAVHELSWFFEGGPWSVLVLQESHCSPAIRHAVIALACSHEDSRENYTFPNQSPQYAYAAQHYSKAIRNLIKETAHDEHESRMRALMCGLLFISLEIIRGNNATALRHLEGCLKIVREAQSRSEPIPLFARVDAQASLFMCRQPQDENILPTVWDAEPPAVLWDPTQPPLIEDHQPFYCFETVLQALNAICSIISKVHCFMGWHSDVYRHKNTPIPSDVLLQKMTLYEQLMQWDAAVQLSIASGTLRNPHDYDKLILLRIHNRTALTLIESCLESSETVFDRYYWAFEDIVNFTTELQGRPQHTINTDTSPSGGRIPGWNVSTNGEEGNESDVSTDESAYHSQANSPYNPIPTNSTTPTNERTTPCLQAWTRPFLPLDNGLIFALYFTALKCRDPYLRRRAISLLSQSEAPAPASHETIRLGKIQAVVAKRVVELEESIMVYTKEVPMEGMMTAADVREEARVCALGTEIDGQLRRAKLRVWTREVGGLGAEMGKEDPDMGLRERVEWVVW